MNESRFKKPLYKNEVAELMGITMSTLNKWLNVRYYEAFSLEVGYNKNQKILTVKQLQWIEQNLGLSPDDAN